jgi:hypothetical protein
MQHNLLNYPNLDVRSGSVFDLENSFCLGALIRLFLPLLFDYRRKRATVPLTLRIKSCLATLRCSLRPRELQIFDSEDRARCPRKRRKALLARLLLLHRLAINASARLSPIDPSRLSSLSPSAFDLDLLLGSTPLSQRNLHLQVYH